MDPPGRQEGIYDLAMRTIRKIESRIDSTFAIHGQMMLLRRSITVVPREGIAADDVDIGLQVRRQGFRIAYAEGARFWEERPKGSGVEARQKRRRGMSLAQALWRNRDMVGRSKYGLFGLVALPFQWAFLLGQPIALALLLTVGLGWLVVAAPLWGAAVIAALAVLAATSSGARSYLHMNRLMLSGMVSMVLGNRITDRWPRDRDAGEQS
jgi:cellulose synthase/poly-beta-1,6-N-acetylglucosamine synthase-like glycosyltransferase